MPWITMYYNVATKIVHKMRLWTEVWDDLGKFEKWIEGRGCLLLDVFELD